MTAYAAALLLLIAVAAPPEANGVYSKTSEKYKTLTTSFVGKVNENIWRLVPLVSKHVKLRSESDVGRVFGTVCDASGKSARNAFLQAFSVDDFCASTDTECIATIKKIFDEAEKQHGPTLPDGVFANCSQLKTSLGANSVDNCN